MSYWRDDYWVERRDMATASNSASLNTVATTDLMSALL
jgi:hypothetical protein